jgi:predicted XRE-type DNA-binding protein
MKNKVNNLETQPTVTRGSVLEDLGFSPAEALETQVKAEIYRDLLDYIRQREFSPRELCVRLGIHQPDVSNLLNGRISKFSVGKLIKFAGKLNLVAQVKLTEARAVTAIDLHAVRAGRTRRVATP